MHLTANPGAPVCCAGINNRISFNGFLVVIKKSVYLYRLLRPTYILPQGTSVATGYPVVYNNQNKLPLPISFTIQLTLPYTFVYYTATLQRAGHAVIIN